MRKLGGWSFFRSGFGHLLDGGKRRWEVGVWGVAGVSWRKAAIWWEEVRQFFLRGGSGKRRGRCLSNCLAEIEVEDWREKSIGRV